MTPEAPTEFHGTGGTGADLLNHLRLDLRGVSFRTIQ